MHDNESEKIGSIEPAVSKA